jgi:hypothetical protein
MFGNSPILWQWNSLLVSCCSNPSSFLYLAVHHPFHLNSIFFSNWSWLCGNSVKLKPRSTIETRIKSWVVKIKVWFSSLIFPLLRFNSKPQFLTHTQNSVLHVFYYRKYGSWGIGYVLGAVGCEDSSQNNRILRSDLLNTPQRAGTRSASLPVNVQLSATEKLALASWNSPWRAVQMLLHVSASTRA